MDVDGLSVHDTQSAQRHGGTRRQIGIALARIRYQLIGGLLFGVIAPIIIRGRFERLPDKIANYDNSLIGCLCALLIGYMMFRKVTALPGAGGVVNVVPVFLSSYSIIIAFFFMFRLDYSRYQFLASFLLVVAWFYLVTFLTARFRSAQFALVSNRKLRHLDKVRGVEWKLTPSLATADQMRHLPLVVDFETAKLTASWERYLADEALSGRPVFNSRDIVESLQGRVKIERLSFNSFGHLAPDSIYSPAKRYLDFFIALIALIVLLPVLLVVACWIRIDSAGPAIFRQERMGYGGHKFTLYKFRSMSERSDNYSDAASDMTQKEDYRVTQVGRFLRRTRLDELPQIINILRGEMSWIGPRPETLNLSAWYESEIPFYRYRHIVRPGLTGWAQVKQGHVTSVDDVREKLEFDFYYVKHFSVWTDILIVIQTIKVILTGHGSR